MFKRFAAACLLSFVGLGAWAQLPDSVDMSAGGAFRQRIDRHTSTKAYRMRRSSWAGWSCRLMTPISGACATVTAVRSATITTIISSTLRPE